MKRIMRKQLGEKKHYYMMKQKIIISCIIIKNYIISKFS